MKIKIDNRDLPYTIDAYQTFTGDDAYESEIEHYTGDDAPDDFKSAGVTMDNWDQKVEWTFDNKAWIKHLAESSVHILTTEFVGRFDYSEWINKTINAREKLMHNIVNSITLDTTNSPAFYNYTTDSYIAEWDINEKQLSKWINDNPERKALFNQYILDNYESYDRDYKFNPHASEFDLEYVYISMLAFYTSSEYDNEQYQNEMFEQIHEYAYECYDFKLITEDKTNA